MSIYTQSIQGIYVLSIPKVYRAYMSIYTQSIQGIYVYLYPKYTGHICLYPKYTGHICLYPKYTGHICLSIPKVYRAYMSIYTQSIQGIYVYFITHGYIYLQKKLKLDFLWVIFVVKMFHCKALE